MPGEIFFNGREWRQIGLSEQQVRLVELLVNRTGGAQSPDLTLIEVTNVAISNQAAIGTANHELELLRRRVESLTDVNNAYHAELKKIQHRVNQLEDAQ